MAWVSRPSPGPVSLARSRRAETSQLVRRVGGLGAILALEVIAASVSLDTGTLHGTSRVVASLADHGPSLLRGAVAFVVVALTFSESALTDHLRRASARLTGHKVDRRLLLVHAGLLLLFAEISSLLFAVEPAGTSEIALTVAWAVTGIAAVAGLALALLPPAVWSELFLRARPILAFAGAATVGACVLGWIALRFWPVLSRGTMAIAYVILSPFLQDLTVDFPTFTIGVPQFRVAVTASCSGSEGLALILVFTLGWLWLNRAVWRFPPALLIIPAGLAAIWITNCVRIAGLVLIGSAGAPDIALGGFHSQAGWVGFNLVAFGLCLGARRVPWLIRDRIDREAGSSNPTAALLLPFLSILAAGMVAHLASDGFEWLYPIRVLAPAVVLVYYARPLRLLDWNVTWTGVAVGVVAFMIWIGLEHLLVGGSATPMPAVLAAASDTTRWTWIGFRILGGVAMVPIAEELAFRGFLLRRLMSRDFESVRWHAVSPFAILLSSLAFGMLHGERWLAATLVGILYALVTRRRGAIGEAVAAHATTNALIAGWTIFGGYWQLW